MHIKLNVKRKFYEFTKPGLAKNWTRKWIWYINNYAIQYNVVVLRDIIDIEPVWFWCHHSLYLQFTFNDSSIKCASNGFP